MKHPYEVKLNELETRVARLESFIKKVYKILVKSIDCRQKHFTRMSLESIDSVKKPQNVCEIDRFCDEKAINNNTSKNEEFL